MVQKRLLAHTATQGQTKVIQWLSKNTALVKIKATPIQDQNVILDLRRQQKLLGGHFKKIYDSTLCRHAQLRQAVSSEALTPCLSKK
jgi:hypothetical protein